MLTVDDLALVSNAVTPLEELLLSPPDEPASDPALVRRTPQTGYDCATSVFDRALCVVDGSPESLDAVRQADTLLKASGTMTLLSLIREARDPGSAEAAWSRYLAEHALRRGHEVLGHRSDVQLRLATGQAGEVLLTATETEGATLVALSGYEAGRAKGPLAGELVARMLMRAPCSLLVARQPRWHSWPPRSIVVGIDDSPHSYHALATAREIASRTGAELRPLAALGGSAMTLARLEDVGPELRLDYRRPARALCDAANDADLVVVGQAEDRLLGSPSTIVALAAVCSVLVVRERPSVRSAHQTEVDDEASLLAQAA